MKHARTDYNRIQDPAGIIPADEPVFLLRGQDVAAPAAIDAWCEAAKKSGASTRIIEAAKEHANKMRVYQFDHQSKIPDMP